MSAPDGPDGPDWDEVVDLICIGVNPGVLACLSLCAAADLDVLVVGLPESPDPLTAEYLAAMTVDLDDDRVEPDPPAGIAVPVPARAGRQTVETFVGEELRRFSARCLHSGSGVLFTQVPDLLTPMRTDTGELLTAATVSGLGEPVPTEGTLAEMVVDEGRIAGALVDGPDGRRLVGAESGLVFAVGRTPGVSPAGPSRALVGRRGGRFARLENLTVRPQ